MSITEHKARELPFISQIPRPGDGFPSVDLAEHWRYRGCGIACLRMVLEGLGAEAQGYWALVAEGLDRRAYNERGWIHQGLVDMARDRGIAASSKRQTTVTGVSEDLQAGHVVVASVTACLRGGQASASGTPQPRGGHLVVVTGVRVGDLGALDALRVHHPSAVEANNWQNRWIPYDNFERSFNHAHMVFGPAARPLTPFAARP
jgi:hypothetical protein